MTILFFLVSIIAGYLLFMMSFYLLAKALFPRIERSPENEEEDLLFQIETTKAEADRLVKEAARFAKRAKTSYRFNKQPQVA